MQGIKVDRKLTRQSINTAIGEVEEMLAAMHAQHKSALKVRLELEEALLAYAENLGESQRFGVACRQRFDKIFVRVIAEGHPFNPLEEVSESTELLARLVAMGDYSPSWNWHDGFNSIEFPVEMEHAPISLTKLMIWAFLAAISAGLVFLFLPAAPRMSVVNMADASFGLLLNVIKGVAGPFIFLTIIGSICAIGDFRVFGRGSMRLLLAIAVVFMSAVVSGVAVARFFTEPGSACAVASGVGGLSTLLINLVPVNLVAPFVNGNIPQILVLAIVFGLTLLALETRIPVAIQLCNDLKIVLSAVMNLVLRWLLAPMVFFCIFSMVASGRMSMLVGSWKIAVLTIGTVSAYTLLAFAFTCVRFRVSPKRLFADVLPSAFIGFTTSSPLASLPQEVATLKKSFKVDPDFADFSSSILLSVSSFGYYTELAVMMVCMAGYYSMAMPLEWLLSAVILVAIAGISTPPFPGTAGIVMGLLLSQLGIPADCVGLLIAIDMAVDYVSCFGNAILRLCIIRNVASSWNKK